LRRIGGERWIGGLFDSVLVELRAAEGGDDAKLLVNELFQIYVRWCRRCGFEMEVAYSVAAAGGFSYLEFVATGPEACDIFAEEAGGHRFQRVPPTEKRGRRQTSTVTVAVLPMRGSSPMTLDDNDLEWDMHTGTGPGGQHQQRSLTAVRLRHLPTGVEVNCQDNRSQHRNKERALEILKARLFAREAAEKDAADNRSRRGQIGSGMRGDKIRTYRFQDGRVVDHRTGRKARLSEILAGNLDALRK
jgi:peptide chain release factor 1